MKTKLFLIKFILKSNSFEFYAQYVPMCSDPFPPTSTFSWFGFHLFTYPCSVNRCEWIVGFNSQRRFTNKWPNSSIINSIQKLIHI